MVSRKNKLPRLLDGSFYDLVQSIDSFFDKSLKRLDIFFYHRMFNVDWYETDSDIIIEAEIPGYKREQIQVEILGNRLRISIEGSEMTEINDFENVHAPKRHTNQKVQRLITLPFLISEKDTRAIYKDGLLRISTPKRHSTKRFINIE